MRQLLFEAGGNTKKSNNVLIRDVSMHMTAVLYPSSLKMLAA